MLFWKTERNFHKQKKRKKKKEIHVTKNENKIKSKFNFLVYSDRKCSSPSHGSNYFV